MRGRLPRDRRVVLCVRRPACDLARRALPDPCGRRFARIDANGVPLERTMLVPSEDVEWTDIWNTVGLRGTASDQFALNDFFVRGDHSITREWQKECREAVRSTA